MPEGSSTHQGHKRPMSHEHLLSTIYHDHCYGKRQKLLQQTPLQEINSNSCQDEEISKKQLKHKIKNLQQQLRRCKKKIGNMAELIDKLQEDLIIKSNLADKLHASFDKIQLSIFQNVQKNTQSLPCGRRYTDDIKEFALTLYFYSPKAYQYVRSILPLPNPSLIRKWSSSVDCEPGFLKEAFQALSDEVKQCPEKKDCCLIMDAMSIRKETVWDNKNDKYDGFINYGIVNPDDPETLASEALVFLLVGARTHWKCPIGYFLGNKISARIQAQLLIRALEMAAESGLRVWSITADGTSVNLSTFSLLGCKFGTTYKDMVTKFKHPTEDYHVYVILDPCHMLKLARNALGTLHSFTDNDGIKIKWSFFKNLCSIQEEHGLKMANKLSPKHMQFEKHKMKVNLAAQTLSSSVADAIEFLDSVMEQPDFKDSQGTVIFCRTIDRLFDMLNSRNPLGKGYKQPLRLNTKDIWESTLRSTADYLLSLKTDTVPAQLLSTHPRKTFIIGFVADIKSTIEMAHEMLSSTNQPFKYVLTYKYSQDHVELFFSCIRAQGGWNNNPNTLQLKYSLRKMLLRNAITASKNANCTEFTDLTTITSTVIPFFHKRKHKTPLLDKDTEKEEDEEQHMVELLDQKGHSDFTANILFYIGGYIVSKLVKLLTCPDCITSLTSQPIPSTNPDHDCCGVRYNSAAAASAFTLFVNNGGLKIPSKSVFQIIEYAELVFKRNVCKAGNSISNKKNLKKTMIINVCHHFVNTRQVLFADHEEGSNERVFEDEHRTKLAKHCADQYFTLRLFTYAKRFNANVVKKGQPSDRHRLTKLILFRGQ